MNSKSDTQNTSAQLSYRDAGVDIDAGNRLVENIKPIATQTNRQGVLAGLGGFGALFELPLERYKRPVLVSCTDGIGTKLKLAIELNQHSTIGIDLVAMCVNDLIVQGAEPLFFLDYYATGKLNIDIATNVVKGIGTGCQLAGAALIGGETAEMPGMYQNEDYDVAGFSVGIVEKERIIDGSRVAIGNMLIGIASSGPHSNGYSLIRKIIEKTRTDLKQQFDNDTLGNALLKPTRIYVKPVLDLIRKIPVHAIAHITGGGLLENLPRVIPNDMMAEIREDTWQRPPIFDWLQEHGNISDNEMYRTFNCGIGMVIAIHQQDADTVINLLRQHGETAWPIGSIQKYKPKTERVVILGAA